MLVVLVDWLVVVVRPCLVFDALASVVVTVPMSMALPALSTRSFPALTVPPWTLMSFAAFSVRLSLATIAARGPTWVATVVPFCNVCVWVATSMLPPRVVSARFLP